MSVIGFSMMVGMFLFWVMLIFLAILFVNSLFQTNRQAQDNPKSKEELTAQQILEQRYARGEITQEQFRLMQQDLQ